MENLVNTIIGIQAIGTFEKEVAESEEARRMLIEKIHSSASTRLNNLILCYLGIIAIVLVVQLIS